jgi:outer membrane protein TolC
VIKERLSENAGFGSDVATSQASAASAKASVLEAKLDLFLLRKQVLTFLGERPN